MHFGEIRKEITMDIQTALEQLNGFFDMLYASGFLTEDEKNTINEVEDTIVNYVREKEVASKSA
jgi:hypothetical protein